MKSRIILLGPPASGKGTQAELLSAKYHLPTASTGALLREERTRGTAWGREADSWTSRGMYFPDEIALQVIGRWLAASGGSGFVLDGFPRTIDQAKAFTEDLDAVCHLSLSDEVIYERLAARVTCARCGASRSTILHGVREGDDCPDCGEPLARRRDDRQEAIEERLEQHRLHTEPVIEFYRHAHRLTEVDASLGRDEVFQQLCESIEETVPA